MHWAGLDWSFPSNPLIPLPWGNRILSKVHPAICPGETFLAGDFCVPVTGSPVPFNDLSGAQMPWQRSQSPLGASRGPALEARGLVWSQALKHLTQSAAGLVPCLSHCPGSQVRFSVATKRKKSFLIQGCISPTSSKSLFGKFMSSREVSAES